ncbi:MAG TPA: ABC transporter permease subunit [Chthonomonadales bacterium]|nr:ABC transporter permease subunit [Chthonomonadales bacterium]
MVTFAIARQTVEDMLRRKILLILLIVGVCLIALGPSLGFLTPRESSAVLRSLGLAVILIAGLLITVISGIQVIPTEIERRTIYTVLSKPVQRYQFVLGKFLGGIMTVFVMIVAMGIVFLGVLFWHEKVFAPDMLKGVLMTFCQMMLLGALTIFFSTFAPPVVNFFMSFGLFIVGNLSTVTESLTENRNPVTAIMATIVHYTIPNFGNFNIQNKLIHPEIVIKNEMVFLTQNVVYAVLYSAVLLVLAILVFDKREV